MTCGGARANTEAQMARVLHFTLGRKKLHPAMGALVRDLNARSGKGGYKLSVANALWGQRGYRFLRDFLDLNRNHYGADLESVDFATDRERARKSINAWVEKKTERKIRDLIKPGVLNPLTRLVLVNAIYFKGDWASQFKKSSTREAPFALAGNRKVNVPMMRQTALFNYFDGDGFQALELPYVGRELSMIVFLPKRARDLDTFERSLTRRNLARWLPRFGRRLLR